MSEFTQTRKACTCQFNFGLSLKSKSVVGLFRKLLLEVKETLVVLALVVFFVFGVYMALKVCV